jgi:multidrug transporter EmrE-like cation transporter
MEMIQFFSSDKRSLAGQFAYAVFTGVCGTLILVVFLNAILNVYQMIKFIPFIVAFNTAMTGYSLIDKSRERIRHRHAWALSAGLSTAVITVGSLLTFSFYFLGENLLGLKLSLFLIIIGAVCSELGALLAAKYFNIK